jgi:DNA-binding transcriptional regulator YiaG
LQRPFASISQCHVISFLTAKGGYEIRRSLKASQALFATYLNVSANAVRSWERGTKPLVNRG